MAQPFRRINWPPEADALLGQAPDGVMAKALGLNRLTVAARRKALNIPPYRKPPRVLVIRCVVCGETTEVTKPPPGGRVKRLRKTCPPPKKCREVLRATTMTKNAPRHKPTSLQSLLRKIPGARVAGLLD